METPIMALKKLKVPIKHVFSCDTDKMCKMQITTNFPEAKFFDDLMARDNYSKDTPAADLYIAGFPCQPFSAAGKGRGLQDARGTVFFGCKSYIEAKKPRMFILENVKRILSNDKGRTWELIWSTLTSLHDGAYHVEYRVLDTQEHGVPQSRPRVYIVGILKAFLPRGFTTLPWPEPLPLLSIEPLLDPIQRRRPTMQDLPPRYPETPYKGAREVLQQLQQEKQEPFSTTYLIDVDASPKFRSYMDDKVMCMTKSRPCGFWISSRGRRMNLNEMLRLQGMERCFQQVVSDKHLGAQIGNAMSQNILERIFIKFLPIAGLVDNNMVLKDRWLQRTLDPNWPRARQVKKIALKKPKETPKRAAAKRGKGRTAKRGGA